MDRIFHIESLDVFQNVAQDIVAQLYYSGSTTNITHFEADVIEKAKSDLISIFNNCNFDTQKIAVLMHTKEWPQDKKEVFLNLVEQHKSELLYAAFNHYNSTYCETVVNFDWLVKYILGTTELKTLKYPLLQLMMSTLNKNGKQTEIMYDLKKDTLLKMINVLENIK